MKTPCSDAIMKVLQGHFT